MYHEDPVRSIGFLVFSQIIKNIENPYSHHGLVNG